MKAEKSLDRPLQVEIQESQQCNSLQVQELENQRSQGQEQINTLDQTVWTEGADSPFLFVFVLLGP